MKNGSFDFKNFSLGLCAFLTGCAGVVSTEEPRRVIELVHIRSSQPDRIRIANNAPNLPIFVTVTNEMQENGKLKISGLETEGCIGNLTSILSRDAKLTATELSEIVGEFSSISVSSTGGSSEPCEIDKISVLIWTIENFRESEDSILRPFQITFDSNANAFIEHNANQNILWDFEPLPLD